MHSKNIIHLDLKPGNDSCYDPKKILFLLEIFDKSIKENLIAEKTQTSFTSVKIIDFGLAVDISNENGKLSIYSSSNMIVFHIIHFIFFLTVSSILRLLKTTALSLAPMDIDPQNKFNLLLFLIRLTCGQ